MDTGTILLTIGLGAIGVFFILAALKKVKHAKKMNPFLAGGLAIVFFVAALACAGYVTLPDFGGGTSGQVATGTVCAEFDITPAAGNVAVLNSGKDGFNVPARADQLNHTIIQEDNATAWLAPTFTFTIDPIPFSGADADDLATIYYEVYDPEVTIDTSSDTYKLFTKSGGHRQILWMEGGNVEYVDGSFTMLMTGNLTITLSMTVTQDSFSRMESAFDATTVYVKFSNGCGWSEIYPVDFFLVDLWCHAC